MFVKGEWNFNCCFWKAISEGGFVLNRLKIPLYIQVLQVQKLKELSLPAVAEELRQMLLEGNVLMFDFKQ